MSDFDDIINADDDVERRRFKLERYVFYFVVMFGVLGITVAIASPSVLQSVVYWFVSTGGNDPVILYYEAVSGNNLSVNSTDDYPTFNNTFVRFNVSFSDVDSDWHTMFVCNGTGGNYTFDVDNGIPEFTCGNRYQFCNYSNMFVTDNPLYCDFYVDGFGNQTQNYTLYVIDSGSGLGNVSGTFVVNRPPYISLVGVVIV